jgi:2-beta-glucuronyltransferase
MPGADEFIRRAQLFVFDSSPGLMLVNRFRTLNPDARYVYRVADDLGSLRAHAVLREAERSALPGFDLVSVPSEAIRRRLLGSNAQVLVHHHGVDKAAFDAPSVTPYSSGRTTAVFVGTAYLDREFIEIAARELPAWSFHVIGPFANLPPLPNVVGHGELTFAETVPYITHADIGLASWLRMPSPEVFSDSLKIIQYTYARLPIVLPDFVGATRSNAIAYRLGDPSSIRTALGRAAAFDRTTISREGIESWDELVAKLVG